MYSPPPPPAPCAPSPHSTASCSQAPDCRPFHCCGSPALHTHLHCQEQLTQSSSSPQPPATCGTEQSHSRPPLPVWEPPTCCSGWGKSITNHWVYRRTAQLNLHSQSRPSSCIYRPQHASSTFASVQRVFSCSPHTSSPCSPPPSVHSRRCEGEPCRCGAG